MTNQNEDRTAPQPSPAPPRRPNRWRVVRRWVGSLAIVAATVAVLLFLGWKKYSEIQAAMNMPPPPEMPTAVGIQPVGKLLWRNSTTDIGTILAPRSITVNNELAGTVAEVHFGQGQLVEEGDLLLTLDTSVEQAQLQAAQVREKFALTAFERNRQMAEKNSIAEKELEDVESAWRQAEAEVQELQAMIARKTITAPFRGRIGLSDVYEGQYLPVGSLITSLQGAEDWLLVEFTLAQSVVSQVKVGDSVQVITDGTTLPADIHAIDAQANRQTRNVRVRARIDNPPASLSPGDSVTVLVEYGNEYTLPGVPAEAVRRSPQGTFLFMAEPGKSGELRASARTVVLATSVGSTVGIASGVVPDEQVVVEGSFKLHDGALIVPAPIAQEQDPAE